MYNKPLRQAHASQGLLSMLMLLLTLTPEISAKWQCYESDPLQLHNNYRLKHGVPELKMDEGLNQKALKCAEYYAKKGDIDHSCPDAKGLGENLAWRERHPEPYSDDEVTKLAIKAWYDEIEDYDFKNYRSKNGKAVGHFTQVVSKRSERLGFGIAKAGARTYAVGLYSPQGNIIGRYEENVFPPKE